MEWWTRRLAAAAVAVRAADQRRLDALDTSHPDGSGLQRITAFSAAWPRGMACR